MSTPLESRGGFNLLDFITAACVVALIGVLVLLTTGYDGPNAVERADRFCDWYVAKKGGDWSSCYDGATGAFMGYGRNHPDYAKWSYLSEAERELEERVSQLEKRCPIKLEPGIYYEGDSSIRFEAPGFP